MAHSKYFSISDGDNVEAIFQYAYVAGVALDRSNVVIMLSGGATSTLIYPSREKAQVAINDIHKLMFKQ